MSDIRKAYSITRRGIVVTSAATLSTACFGSFNLTRLVYDFNEDVDNKWLRWLLFLGLVIVPVYGIATFVDAVVINSIEFWTGDNPVDAKVTPAGEGRRVVSAPTENPSVVRHEVYKGDELERVIFVERDEDGTVALRDATGKPLTVAQSSGTGVEVVGGKGQRLVHLPGRGCKELADALDAGHPVAACTADTLERYGQGVALLSPVNGGHGSVSL